ncbi:MAG: hypothetical protein PHQ40_08650 [Anaerolineaceae bacterium]|nr:hypothetical protein [Anaerolineaceae bacterium]
MIRSLFSMIGLFLRLALVLVLLIGLGLVAFVAVQGNQPMPQGEAHGMTYWQFLRERIDVIQAQPPRCQRYYFLGFALTVPMHPFLYTYIGIYPDSILAHHTQPDPLILKTKITWQMAPKTWWSLVEAASWDVWVQQRVAPAGCRLPTPKVSPQNP